MSCRGSDTSWVKGREECSLVGACLYGRELLVEIDNKNVRRVRESQGEDG